MNEPACYIVTELVKKLTLFFAFALPLMAASLQAGVQITLRPSGLVHGQVQVPVSATEDITRVELLINNIPFSAQSGRSMVFTVPVGEYLRRLRIRAVGYDARGQKVAEDEIVVNDPRPPFRIKLSAPQTLPSTGMATMSASVSAPENLRIDAVDFYVGEERVGTDASAPYAVQFDASRFVGAVYARALARTGGGPEANDILFWGNTPRMELDVALQQIPVSVAGRPATLTKANLRLNDGGTPRKIENVVAATDQPLNVIMLIDQSQSMLTELPVIKSAARAFARSLIRPTDRMAVVAFNERAYWLTPFTSDVRIIDAAVDQLRPRGQTHLYDITIQMLYELQKLPGRHALVVLSDGANQGGSFNIDHLVHYARYSGIPVYPVIKNTIVSRLMKFGVGRLQTRRLSELAKDTGATYFLIERTEQIPAVYQKIAAELNQQYLVTFYSDAAAADQWRPLRVESTQKDINLRAPRGYFP